MCPPISLPVRSARYCSATQTVYSAQARHSSVAQLFNVLYQTAPADLGVWSIYPRRPCLSQRANELRGTVMPRLRKLTHMCSRTVSDTANRLRKTRKKKSSAVPLISERSHVGNLRQIKKQGKGRSSKRKGNRRCPFLFAHRRGYGAVPAAGAATSRRPQTANPPAEVQRKTSRPLGTNTLAQFEYPAQPVLRNAARIGRTACAPRASQRVGAGIACVAVKPPQLHINYVCVTPTYTV